MTIIETMHSEKSRLTEYLRTKYTKIHFTSVNSTRFNGMIGNEMLSISTELRNGRKPKEATSNEVIGDRDGRRGKRSQQTGLEGVTGGLRTVSEERNKVDGRAWRVGVSAGVMKSALPCGRSELVDGLVDGLVRRPAQLSLERGLAYLATHLVPRLVHRFVLQFVQHTSTVHDERLWKGHFFSAKFAIPEWMNV